MLVTTLGMAVLLLPEGRIAHSWFNILLEMIPNAPCGIKRGTQLANLLLETSLIIWDETLVANKFFFQALDKSLRDVLSLKSPDNKNKIFGGMTNVLEGDLRQILLVIPKGRRSDIVEASITSSHLYCHFEVLSLKINMHLQALDITPK